MRILAATALLAVLLAVQPGPADPPSYRRSDDYRQVRNHQTHRQIVRLVDVVQINPAYTSAYDPRGYDTTTQEQLAAELHKISARLDQNAAQRAADQAAQAFLLQRLAAWQGVPGVPNPPATPTTPPAYSTIPQPKPEPGTLKPEVKAPAPPGAPLSGLAVLNAKCAACHQDGKLEPNQRFILLSTKGELSPLTTAQGLKVLTKTYLGQMPPPVNKFGLAPITNEEYAALVQLLAP